ncbi:MAG: hypothetical protein M5R42_08180 [Rhodocyclaceae bacterium]|nr:hypothetical protein [Rhodocyclaceae bacterium]
MPVSMPPRIGKSHIRPFRDGIRFILIIIKIGTLYSPMKLFLPVSGAFFATGLGYYTYTYLHHAPLHQHERAAVHHVGADIPDRPGVRADHDAYLQGR